jgi:RNA polymerase sigma-70 factor (ECF subfamily)
MDERQAIARLKRGDPGGLEVLVRRYQVRAIRAAYLIVRDQALAEDVVQAAFLRAFHRIRQFDADRPFGPWFLRGVVNDAIKAAARRGRQVSLDQEAWEDGPALADLLPDPSPGPPELAEQAEVERAIWEALGRLAPAQRAAVVLRYYLDFGEAEMAAELDAPPGTIKWRLHAARERLRSLLRPLGPGSQAEQD